MSAGRSRRSLCRRRGSAVLLLCVIAIPMILVLATLLQGARHQTNMLDIERALSAQVQARLAGFDKALFDEFGLMALDSDTRNDTFTRMLPPGLKDIKPVQSTDKPLSDPAVLKAGIFDFMRLRLPASLLQTIMSQTGITIRTGGVKPLGNNPPVKASFAPMGIFQPASAAKPANAIQPVSTIRLAGIGGQLFADTVGEAFSKLLSDAIYKVLDDEIKGALTQYRAYAADCVSSGESQQLVAFPDLFSPEQLGGFTDVLSSAMTVPASGLYNRLAIREYILATFWPAGQPSQAATAAGADIRIGGEHLEFRNLSGSPLKSYGGRQAGEVEQILTGAKTPKSAISQVKAILVVYRAALFIGRKLAGGNALASYRATGALLSAAIVAATGGVLIDPEILAYVLLACDGLRQGFSDYGRLMKGERLAFAEKAGSAVLALDYAMHLRVLLLLSPEKKLLERTASLIGKRHSGTRPTSIIVSCQFKGQQRTRRGSLLTAEAAS